MPLYIGLWFGLLGNGKTGLGSGAAADAPEAPAITWNSLETDNEPDFLVDLPSGWGDYRDAAEGDHLIIEYDADGWNEYIDRTLSAGDISDDTITITGVGSISDGTYNFRARLERGAAVGTNSAIEVVTIAAATTAGQPIGLLLLLTKAA